MRVVLDGRVSMRACRRAKLLACLASPPIAGSLRIGLFKRQFEAIVGAEREQAQRGLA